MSLLPLFVRVSSHQPLTARHLLYQPGYWSCTIVFKFGALAFQFKLSFEVLVTYMVYASTLMLTKPPQDLFLILLQIPCITHRNEQFSACYDLYLAVLRNVRSLVRETLGCDTPHWRLKNACPACTYKLKNEPEMKFSMLITMDGNDSLKRILSASTNEYTQNNMKEFSEYFIDREEVDKWGDMGSVNMYEEPVGDTTFTHFLDSDLIFYH